MIARKNTRQKAVLLSLKPHYFERIREGSKTVELRRRFPTVPPGTVAILYVSAPVSAIMALVVVRKTLEATPSKLWAMIGNKAAVSREEFDRYFSGANNANGIILERFSLVEPISLDTLKAGFSSFHPPQSFRYVDIHDSPETISFGLPGKVGTIAARRLPLQ